MIENTVKSFIEAFSQGTISDARANVHNAGRYNAENDQVNVDMIPYLVTVLDGVNDEVLRQANDDLENEVDRIVTSGLARDLAVPMSVSVPGVCKNTIYTNFLY